jgi:hypothetical protein
MPDVTIMKAELEQMMSIAHDTRKEFHYLKDTSAWSWQNRNEEVRHGPFNSFLDALQDAVGPYMYDGK